LEGRVILLVDGSPFALILPTVFSQFYQTIEDYSERFLLVSFIRLSRLVALIFSLIFPSLYVALISFNPELIPTEFAVAVAGGRAGVPFPSVIEVLIMEISMEVLREATLRLPQQVGGALSIVGVLVVGQAAVAAGFISPITVVIIALTTIGSFATPAYNAALALRLLRFPPNDTRLGKITKEMSEEAPNNTLDPLKVGDTRRNVTDGASSPDHSHTSGDHTD
jgi:spore germination protein KA